MINVVFLNKYDIFAFVGAEIGIAIILTVYDAIFQFVEYRCFENYF